MYVTLLYSVIFYAHVIAVFWKLCPLKDRYVCKFTVLAEIGNETKVRNKEEMEEPRG